MISAAYGALAADKCEFRGKNLTAASLNLWLDKKLR
jgi:hypothetical protein